MTIENKNFLSKVYTIVGLGITIATAILMTGKYIGTSQANDKFSIDQFNSYEINNSTEHSGIKKNISELDVRVRSIENENSSLKTWSEDTKQSLAEIKSQSSENTKLLHQLILEMQKNKFNQYRKELQ